MEINSAPEKESLFEAQSPSEFKGKSDQIPEKDEEKTIEKDENAKETTIKYISGNLNSDDLYALPNKRRDETKVCEIQSDDDEKDDCCELKSKDSIEEKDSNKDLPFGWEKHEDNDGPYYWHIKSGTIQREPPVWPKQCQQQQHTKELKSPDNFHYQSSSFSVRSPSQISGKYDYNQVNLKY